MPHVAEHLRSPAAQSIAISVRSPESEGDLWTCCPEVAFLDETSPLGLGMRRLTEALDAAEKRAERGFTSDLIGLVPDLRRFALSLTRDATESEDLVQYTLLKAWVHRTSYTLGTGLKAWLFTVLRNSHINGRKKYRREVPDPDGSHAAGLSSLADQEGRIDLRDVQEALDRLDPAQREALLLVAIEDLSYEDAARRIGCPPGTVKSRVSRARCRLAVELGAS